MLEKYLVLCTNLTEGQNLSLIKCRNFWSYSKGAFSPFCSKFKTCCFSDRAGNCYSWSKAVSHCLQPQPLLLFPFPSAQTRWIPQSMLRDGSSAISSPSGSWLGISLKPAAHSTLVSLPQERINTSPIWVAWRNLADFKVPAGILSLPLALSSKDSLGSVWGLFLPLICHWDPGVAPVSPSQFADLAIGWKATKSKETPSKYNKVKAAALENSGRKREKKGTKEIILARFYSWRPEAQSWDPHSSNLCKTTSSLRSMVGWRPLHWVQLQCLHHMGWYKPNPLSSPAVATAV